MRKLFYASTIASGLMLGAGVSADAMTAQPLPLASFDAPSITLVSGGCGPAFHRTPFGTCRPNFYRPYAVYRPFGFGYHRYGWHRWHRW